MGGSMIECALAYAEAGHRVFPIWGVRTDGSCQCNDPKCASPGKHPHGRLVPQGLTDASDDAKAIESWWRQYPGGNIGLVTGELFFVIDCDKHEGVDGTALFLQLAEQRGGIPETACADTGGGGAHFLFGYDSSVVTVRNQQGLLVDGARIHGIDVRGEGGYIVAPPSIHASGRTYVWKHDLLTCLKATPAWVLALAAGSAQVNPAFTYTKECPDIGLEGARQDRIVADWEVVQIRAALRLMPPNCNRQIWIEQVSMPLHDMFGGSQVGFEIWHEWCEKGRGLHTPNGKPAYGGEAECLKIWRSFHASHRNPKGPATFWQYAYECGWRPPENPGNNGRELPWPVSGVTASATFDDEELADSVSGPGDPGPFPDSIALSLEGPISELVEWMTEAARRPDRTIAFAASLAVVAGAMGRRVIGPQGTRATLALAMLAPSGSGKDKPQACIKNLLESHPNLMLGLMDDTPTHRTQLDDLLLKNKGQGLMVLDEYGSTLERWLRQGDTMAGSMSPTIRRLATHDLTIYHLAPVSLRHPSRAANVNAWDAGIFAPSFSLIGFTTPSQFYAALNDSSLTDGFLGRHVVIATQSTADLRSPRASTMDVPPGVLAWVESVERVPVPRVGPPPSFRPQGPPGTPTGGPGSPGTPPDMSPIDPRPVDWASDEAEASWEALSREIDRSAHDSIGRGDETLGAILRRLPGQTMTVALVLACGEAPTILDAAVTERHIDLAYRVCRWSADQLAWRLRRGVAGDDFGRAHLTVCEVIERRSPKTVYRSYFGSRVKISPYINRIWPLIQNDPRFIVNDKCARVRGIGER